MLTVSDLAHATKANLDANAHFTILNDATCAGMVAWIRIRLGDTWLGTGPLDPSVHWTPQLMLVDPDQGNLFIASSRGLEGQNLLGRRTSVRSGVAGSVAQPEMRVRKESRGLLYGFAEYHFERRMKSVPMLVRTTQ